MLTDVIMPGLDGSQLEKVASGRWPGMKVIFMSGYSEYTAINCGCVDPDAWVLSKPFSKVELAKRARDARRGLTTRTET